MPEELLEIDCLQSEELESYQNVNIDEFDSPSIDVFSEHEECYLPQHEIYLKKRNYFSEFSTEAEKQKARLALGIGDSYLLRWENIQGDIQNNQSLVALIANSITQNTNDKIVKELTGNTAITQIKYNTPADQNLNKDYVKCLQDLEIAQINSLSDAIKVLYQKVFPIEYTDWDITYSLNTPYLNCAYGYSAILINNQEINLAISINQVNNKNIPATMHLYTWHPYYGVEMPLGTLNLSTTGKYYVNTNFYDLGILTSGNSLNVGSLYSTYNVRMKIYYNNTVVWNKTTTFNLYINPTHYNYFYKTTNKDAEFNFANAVKQEGNEFIFRCGNDDTYLTIVTSQEINKIEAAAAADDNFPSYSVVNNYTHTTFNGKLPEASGYVVSTKTFHKYVFNEPQNNNVKIRIS